MIAFVTVARQDDCMRDYLSLWGRELQTRIQIVHYEDLLTHTSLSPGTYILAALDQLDGRSVATLTDLHRAHVSLPGFRFVNHPSRTLRRHQLLDELHRLGLNRFRAVRATGDLSSLTLPIFLRGESNHDGPLTPLLHTPRVVDGGVALVARRGWRLDDVLGVEFCETRDDDGLYRKYAAFFVGDHIIPRSLFHGRRWMMKQASAEFSHDRSLEELEYVMQNPHLDQLRRIKAIAGVEYGRIDYSVTRGRVQTWEINLKPTIGRGALRKSSGRVPSELVPMRRQVKEAFYRDFQAALLALDSAAGEPAVGTLLVVPAPRPAPARAREARLKRWLLPLWLRLARVARWPRPLYDRIAVVLFAPVGRKLRARTRS